MGEAGRRKRGRERETWPAGGNRGCGGARLWRIDARPPSCMKFSSIYECFWNLLKESEILCGWLYTERFRSLLSLSYSEKKVLNDFDLCCVSFSVSTYGLSIESKFGLLHSMYQTQVAYRCQTQLFGGRCLAQLGSSKGFKLNKHGPSLACKGEFSLAKLRILGVLQNWEFEIHWFLSKSIDSTSE